MRAVAVLLVLLFSLMIGVGLGLIAGVTIVAAR